MKRANIVLEVILLIVVVMLIILGIVISFTGLPKKAINSPTVIKLTGYAGVQEFNLKEGTKCVIYSNSSGYQAGISCDWEGLKQ